ncbi:MAG: hypothetical protein CVU14_04955 [Bacteroidetes bacterium HGW-Bacteroidetes-9]|jgi:hypothetical protein|nr:MAG: hypothetical protein CVU14_04955 [Bacteroidetes bacterium HGW-Bacteroidetes-9]
MAKARNEELFKRLRSEYKVFNYESYSLKITDSEIIIDFSFNLDGRHHFNPIARIKAGNLVKNLAEKAEKIRPLLENITFQIGMIELISYWKAACPPVINIKPGSITPEQAQWWKKIYFNGLGEFFYLNSIQAEEISFVELTSPDRNHFLKQKIETNNKFLVPIGGGKDSAVTLSLLKEANKTLMPLIMNPRGATIETIKAAGLTMDDVLVIERNIDPKLLELNKQGFLNGHTPFSAMLAFYTLLSSAVSGYSNIALSNESSANESTIPGTNINHQYSKSLGFEQDFRHYVSRFIGDGFNYFSLLRPLSEIQIARIFSSLTHYHKVFRSCNAGSKTDEWCGKCPKCLFTHIMLSAFNGIEDANRIIGHAMLDDQSLQSVFDELAGYSAIKPFECVGTTLEVKQALQMISARSNGQDPILLRRFAEKSPEKINPPDFGYFEETHFVPEGLLNILKQKLQ